MDFLTPVFFFEASAHDLVPAWHGTYLGRSYVYYLSIGHFLRPFFKVQKQVCFFIQNPLFRGSTHTVWSLHSKARITMEVSSKWLRTVSVLMLLQYLQNYLQVGNKCHCYQDIGLYSVVTRYLQNG